MSTFGYLVAGFAAVWVAVFAYLWMLARRSAALQDRVEALESRLERDAPADGSD